ncbi:hypothetical protein OB236_22430 [Paenibacillus sp. WQ 127069]|uniref:Uncharacterized protein n=1 Tax=Paenibacillus baimaensis TaxID=2982185 RepID=A0ABT2UJP6_9BACL|nr:hypothetical protein [Paenibacillus sp. WQ 127069]
MDGNNIASSTPNKWEHESFTFTTNPSTVKLVVCVVMILEQVVTHLQLEYNWRSSKIMFFSGISRGLMKIIVGGHYAKKNLIILLSIVLIFALISPTFAATQSISEWKSNLSDDAATVAGSYIIKFKDVSANLYSSYTRSHLTDRWGLFDAHLSKRAGL